MALLYRSGSSDNGNNSKLLDLLEEISELKPPLVATGDINLRDINWEYMTAPGSDIHDYNHSFIE